MLLGFRCPQDERSRSVSMNSTTTRLSVRSVRVPSVGHRRRRRGSKRCVATAAWSWRPSEVPEPMATASDGSVSFDETDSRRDEMHSTIDAWLDDLVDAVDDAQASEQFRRWLDVQSLPSRRNEFGRCARIGTAPERAH